MKSRAKLLVVIAAACLALAGCGHQRIRDASDELLRTGEFERAVAKLERGVADHPDSAVLQAGLVRARGDALYRLLAEAAAARDHGRLDEAEAALRRAARFDTGGKRVTSLRADLETERRQRQALTEAQALAAQERGDAALRVIADALKDSPRQPDLISLQRKLEIAARDKQVRLLQQGLAESRPISLDFRDANLRTVLDVVTRNSGINFVLDKDIRPDVRTTVLLRSAKVEDAIDLIVSTNQLAKKIIDGQTILIYPNTPEKQREHQEQVIRVFYLASADAKEAAGFLRAMLRIREPYIDTRTNMVAIRESADNIQLAERLMALYDTSDPEVLLELEVIEIRTSRLTDLGIQFPESFSLTPLAPAGAAGLTVGNVRGLTRNDIALGIGGLLVNLKRQVGDFHTLANPRIRSKNKEKAKILIGDKVPVITATITSGTGGFVSDSVSYIDVGLKLDVEPTVYADDEVAIKVGLEVSSIAGQVPTRSGSLAYQIGTRNASTMLRLRDGETQLLAGLISNEDRSAANRVPGLGDLPIAGRLFSSQRDESNRTELVLAITPHVLRNVRRPDANETELWVGTEMSPRMRPAGGRASGAAGADTSTGATPHTGRGTPVPALATPGGAAASQASGLDKAAAAPPDAVGGGSVRVQWRAPSEVRVGDTFVALLEIDSATPLRGAPLQIGFNKEALAVVDIDEGDFFRQGGAPTSFTKTLDNAAGSARAGLLRNQPTGSQGRGTVVAVRMKALTAGTGELRVDALQPLGVGDASLSTVLPLPLRVQVR